MLEIKGLGTPNVQISKTHVRKHLNIKKIMKEYITRREHEQKEKGKRL